MNYYDNDKSFDKRTLIAVVLSVIVITVGFTVQGIFFPPANQLPVASTAQVETTPPPAGTPAVAPSAPVTGTMTDAKVQTGIAMPVVEAPESEKSYSIGTDLLDATFTNKGGELVSLKLKKHLEKDKPLDLFLPDENGLRGFSLAFGASDSAPERSLMNARVTGDDSIEFWRVFFYRNAAGENVPYTMRKRFTFKPGEYMFQLSITFENSRNEPLAIGSGGNAYTLSYGPQIGPRYLQLPANADFRKFVVYEDGKRKEIRPKGGRETLSGRVSWSAIAGKYFALVVIPDATQYAITYVSTTAKSYPVVTALAFTRPEIKSALQTDTFTVYAGPKSTKDLVRYEDAKKNAFQRNGDRLENVLEGNNILGWLEQLLKISLNFFYTIIPNYGIAIILVTLLVKLLMFPLTKKQSESTARMQELQPRLQEIQAKYKGNPQKLNAEVAAFYQKEGYNPLSGCLPILIQFPIFIAMYQLFNNHFDLRGAMFIPGWIPDLSIAEAVWRFPEITILFFKVSAIRALPVIYVASQLLYGKFTQQPQGGNSQNAQQMKFMMYGMPIMFFFILYDVPSGLLVYWIASNIFTIFQQVAINKWTHAHRLAAGIAGDSEKSATQETKIGKIKRKK